MEGGVTSRHRTEIDALLTTPSPSIDQLVHLPWATSLDNFCLLHDIEHCHNFFIACRFNKALHVQDTANDGVSGGSSQSEDAQGENLRTPSIPNFREPGQRYAFLDLTIPHESRWYSAFVAFHEKQSQTSIRGLTRYCTTMHCQPAQQRNNHKAPTPTPSRNQWFKLE